MNKKNRFGISPVIIIIGLLCLTGFCKKEEDEETTGAITDKDGNVYTSVTIGTQVWMKENLKTTKYNDGTAIPLVTNNTEWGNLTTPGYCWYNNDATANKATYGALYNWYAVNTGKLCPTGWHVPSDSEWTILITFLGENDAGRKLKEIGNSHWESPNDATNETGFTALPGGYRLYDGNFNYLESWGFWLSSTEYSTENAIQVNMNCRLSFLGIDYFGKNWGFSVRCLKN
jgi:uncharacterized protein (TIGR02145 family)